MSIFEGPKSRRIKELEEDLRRQRYAFNYFTQSEIEKREKLQDKIDELEAIKQPAALADMIFAKYNINWTPVKNER